MTVTLAWNPGCPASGKQALSEQESWPSTPPSCLLSLTPPPTFPCGGKRHMKPPFFTICKKKKKAPSVFLPILQMEKNGDTESKWIFPKSFPLGGGRGEGAGVWRVIILKGHSICLHRFRQISLPYSPLHTDCTLSLHPAAPPLHTTCQHAGSSMSLV